MRHAPAGQPPPLTPPSHTIQEQPTEAGYHHCMQDHRGLQHPTTQQQQNFNRKTTEKDNSPAGGPLGAPPIAALPQVGIVAPA